MKARASSSIRVSGSIEIIETDARTGKRLSCWRGKNTVTAAGLALIGNRLIENAASPGASLYALGSNSTPPTGSETALLAETYRSSLTQTSVSGGQLKMTLHLGSTQGNGLTFQEGGASNSANVLLCRAVFPAKAKTSAKELTIVHTINFTIV